MKMGFVGLGKMGANLVRNMVDHQLDVVVYNRSPEKIQALEAEGIAGAYSLELLLGELEPPRVVWMMVPAGEAVDTLIEAISPMMESGDILIDAGNSHFRDTQRRGAVLNNLGIRYLDAGTSGGVDGARNGACMMVGGDKTAYDLLEPVIQAVCVPGGYGWLGASGAGHYAKMIHNGIEYGMMEAIGEGFELMKGSEFNYDYKQVAGLWGHGSIIAGYLMDMTEKAFREYGTLEEVEPRIDSTGEGQWTVEEALRQGISVPILMEALMVRFRSRTVNSFSNRLVASLRNAFGGHNLHMKGKS